MTQDKPQTITEDDLEIFLGHNPTTKFGIERWNDIKQQILDGLKALEELPKVQKQFDDECMLFKLLTESNSKLKTEIEELKRQLQK